MIKDDFLLGFPLKEVLFITVVGAVFFYTIQLHDKGLAYQWMVPAIIFIGALLLEVSTTQQRFLDILVKVAGYISVQKLYSQDTGDEGKGKVKK